MPMVTAVRGGDLVGADSGSLIKYLSSHPIPYKGL
jgi:hypothetical protein